MRIIVVEGLDNTGKTTVINTLKENFEKEGLGVKVIHCEKPLGNTNEEMAQYQNESFLDIANRLIGTKKAKDVLNVQTLDVAILDRAWYGEYVYGQLYREHDPLDIEMNINTIEDSLNFFFKPNELSFVLLNVDNIEFSMKHDDGLSISNADIEKMKLEQKMFVEIFNMSKIKNKRNIIVNNGLEFRSKQAIMKDVYSVIK